VVAAEKRVSAVRIVVLAVLVAALGAYLWFYEVPQAAREAEKEGLVAATEDAITGLELAYPDRTITLVKDGGAWRLVKPVEAAADETVVKSMLTAVLGAKVQKSLDELPADLGAFGLATPATTIRLTAKDGTVPPIHVGGTTKIGAKAYVRKGDEAKIYLTASTLKTSIDKQVRDLRDKQLLAFEDDDVVRVEVAKPGAPPTVLARTGDGWTVGPGGQPADPTEVRTYLASLRTTRAVDFPDDAPADLGKYGLATPRLTVTVATGKDGATTQQLLVGAEAPGETAKQIYVKRPDRPTVFAVGEWALRSFDKDAAALRDKTVLAFDPAALGRMVLERKEGAGATFVRTADGAWTVDGADAVKAKATAIQRLADDAKDLKGSGIAAEPPGDLARFGLAAPTLRLALADKSGQPVGTILAAKHDGKYYVMREGGPTVFETRDYMYTRLDKQARDFEQAAGAPAAAGAGDEADDDAEDDLPLEDEAEE
jgi:hypothetical protein